MEQFQANKTHKMIQALLYKVNTIIFSKSVNIPGNISLESQKKKNYNITIFYGYNLI